MKYLSFDDVLIEPRYSEIRSRFDPRTFKGLTNNGRTSNNISLTLPLISANMSTVTGVDMACALNNLGTIGVHHRFLPKEELYDAVELAWNRGNVSRNAVSIGVGKKSKVQDHVMRLWDSGANILVVDVAHGHHILVKETIEAVREVLPEIFLVAGNIATPQGAMDLWDWGADAVKVGIGPGAACTTRETTGVGVPQLSAILRVAEIRDGYDLYSWERNYTDKYIIADGGIKNSGDFCKAIAAGADLVMAGSIFAGCDESPGEIIEEHDKIPVSYSNGDQVFLDGYPTGRKFKVYRGESSNAARCDFFGTEYNEHVAEGIEGMVPAIGPVENVITQYHKALQSSMSYVGAANLKEYKEKARLIEVSTGSAIETRTRV